MDKAKLVVYRDYAIKCEQEGSHHKFIYGSLIKKDEYIEETEIFKRYSLPLYGDPTHGDHFIGFEYGRIYSLYDKLHYSYDEKLKLIHCKIPKNIKLLFKELYPSLKAHRHAIIQNVRNSHYTSANVMYGYWICSYVEECSNKIMLMSGHDLGNKLEITSVGHNMMDTGSTPSEYLIGIRMASLTSNEGDDDHNILAKQLSKTYSSKEIELPSREYILEILHKIHPTIDIVAMPMLCVVQEMCYCCT